MSNPNDLRLAHLRRDRRELERMQDSYNHLSPETREQYNADFHLDLTELWLHREIAELEAGDE